MGLSNDSFLALLEERISKRDGNSAKKLIFILMQFHTHPPAKYQSFSAKFSDYNTFAQKGLIYRYSNQNLLLSPSKLIKVSIHPLAHALTPARHLKIEDTYSLTQ